MENLRQQVVDLAKAVEFVEGVLGTSAVTFSSKISAFSELYDRIDSLIKQQSGRKILSWNRADHFPELLQWIEKFPGADVSQVEIKEAPGRGYGVYLKESISPESERPVIRVPQSACITGSYSSSFAIGRCLSILPLPENLKLVGILMSEVCQLNESQWSCYLRSLPTDFSTIMHLDPVSLRCLEGSIYFDDVVRRYCNVCKHYMNSVIAVDIRVTSKGEKKKFASLFTFELFRWALDVVMTRSNAVPVPGLNEPIIALIPLLDIINHGKGKDKFSCVSDESKTFFAELRSTQELNAGEELLMSYQPLSVKNRLINNAFVTADEGIFQLFIDLQSQTEESVKSILGDCDAYFHRRENGTWEVLGEFLPSGQVTDLTLTVLRTAVALRERDLCVGKAVPEIFIPTELTVDKQVYTIIVRTATELLNRFPKASAEDGHSSALKDCTNVGVAQLCRDEVAVEKARLQCIISHNSDQLKSVLKLLVISAKDQRVAVDSAS
ncbi:actin-histidine N-methyltransferase-like [Paramacrobiotus metropolitanus]|uniref:actin-histidine N-methyltransferase-like n=1 Tax=Paramacrobiotus metropolitanus TaxID=2943436 RepID=UPI0024458EAF|nr:actin-histidine N-methyltransferase-like [Paramacrobiotus metropolitanus]